MLNLLTNACSDEPARTLATATANVTTANNITGTTTTVPKTSGAVPTNSIGLQGKLSLIGLEKELYIARFDGQAPELILGTLLSGAGESGTYDWPTWSKDGTKLAVMSLNFKDGEFTNSDTVIVKTDGSKPYKIQTASPNYPIFHSWSPDGNALSILGSNKASKLELNLLDKFQNNPIAQVHTISEGTAVYTAWSPDSQQFMIHTSRSANDSNLALLATKNSDAPPLALTAITKNSFRTPAFSNDGQFIAFGTVDVGQDRLSISDNKANDKATIILAGTKPAFNWSPTTNKLAYSYLKADSEGFYDGIYLTDAQGSPPQQIVSEPLLGFFWSPNGNKLAYVGLSKTDGILTWKVYDLTTKKATELTEWFPSQTNRQLLGFFDQYAQVNSIWSPNSDALVFAGYSKDDISKARSQPAGQLPPSVYAVALDGKLTRIAAGTVAFWASN